MILRFEEVHHRGLDIELSWAASARIAHNPEAHGFRRSGQRMCFEMISRVVRSQLNVAVEHAIIIERVRHEIRQMRLVLVTALRSAVQPGHACRQRNMLVGRSVSRRDGITTSLMLQVV